MKKIKFISVILVFIVEIIAVFVSSKLGNVTGIWRNFIFMCVLVQGIISVAVAKMYEEENKSLDNKFVDSSKNVIKKEEIITKLNTKIDNLLYSKNNESFYKVVAYFNKIDNHIATKNISYDVEIFINCINDQFCWNNIIVSSNKNIKILQEQQSNNNYNYKLKRCIPNSHNNRFTYEFDMKDKNKCCFQSRCFFKVIFPSIGLYDITFQVLYNASIDIFEKVEYSFEVK